jgi:hypothetical protein
MLPANGDTPTKATTSSSTEVTTKDMRENTSKKRKKLHLTHLLQSKQVLRSLLSPPRRSTTPHTPRSSHDSFPPASHPQNQTSQNHGAPTRTAPPSAHLTRFNASFPSRTSLLTFIISGNALSSRTFVTHFLHSHFDGNLFNVTLLRSNADVREKEGCGGVWGIF